MLLSANGNHTNSYHSILAPESIDGRSTETALLKQGSTISSHSLRGMCCNRTREYTSSVHVTRFNSEITLPD